jgi:hypothetical protein
MNDGVRAAANRGAIGVQIFVTEAIARDVAAAPRERDNRRCVIRIAVIVAPPVQSARDTAAPASPTAVPAAPSGFGRNGQ